MCAWSGLWGVGRQKGGIAKMGGRGSSSLVVLINPAPLRFSSQGESIRERYPYPPLGLLSLAGQLLMHGHEVAIVDFFRERYPSRAEFQARLRAFSREAAVVGLTTYTETVGAVQRIAAAVRQVWPATLIVAGGPHATFCPDELLAGGIDVVVRNEGEAAMVELLEHRHHPEAVPLSSVPGIAFRGSDGRVHQTHDRPFVRNLDCLPLPPFHLLPPSVSSTNETVFVFMSSRGCPGRCVFCASRAMAGAAYRMHSAEYLAALVWHEFERTSFDGMGVMDDTFLVDVRRLEAFCAYLDEMGLHVPWTCKSRADTLHPRALRTLRRAGCRSIHIGVESGDDGVLKSIDKRISLSRVLNGIVAMCANGIRPECSFIIGHHCDSLATMERTLLLARAIIDNDIGVAVVGVCTPLPGTPLFRRADELGLRLLTRDWEKYDLNTPVFETDAFTADDVRRAQYYFEVGATRGEPLNLSGTDHTDYQRLLTDFVARVREVKGAEHTHAG